MGQKSQQDALFSDFARKNICSHAHILSKKRPFCKNTMLFCPYFVNKTSILSKTRYSHVIFLKFFMKHPFMSCPYLVKNTSILSKLRYIYELKKSIGCPFFQIFHEKLTALMPLFCYKNVNFLQTLCSYAHILSKNVNYLQKQCSHVIFFKIFV